MKKLTEREKELIGIILDYEKEYSRRAFAVAEALGLGDSISDLIPYERVEKALRLNDTHDAGPTIICSYINGDCTLDAVFEAIEYVMNVDTDNLRKWFERHDV